MEPETAPDPIAAQTQHMLEQLSHLTLSLVQQREELAQQERRAESLAAEITQRRLRIEADQEQLHQVRGAVAVLQQLRTGEQSAGDAA